MDKNKKINTSKIDVFLFISFQKSRWITGTCQLLGKGLGAVWSVLLAISRAPSCVLFPPMKPLAWTKMQPGIPHSSDSASSRTPRHSSKILNLETHHTISRNHVTINAKTDLNEFITSNSEHNKFNITLYKSTLEEQGNRSWVSQYESVSRRQKIPHLFWKVFSPAGTHWTLQWPFWSVYSTNLMGTSTFISFSRTNRCSFQGQPPWASNTISPLGSTCTGTIRPMTVLGFVSETLSLLGVYLFLTH